MKRILPPLLATAVAAGLLAAPRETPAGDAVWQDAMGRDVALRLPARRIVSLAPSATEALFAIGAGDQVAAVSRHCDFPLEAKLKPKAGDFNQPDLEKVTAAAPDVVLFTEYGRPEDLAALGRAGIAVFVLPARSFADVPATLRRLGALTGRAEQAESLSARIEAAAREVTSRLAALREQERPSVYVEVDGPERLYAVGPGSFMDDIVRLAGGRNVFAGRAQPYFPVASAEVVAADPAVILVDYPFAYKAGVAKRPGWEAIAAVRSGRVFDGTDYDTIRFNRPGPRIAGAVAEIARLLHPGIFRAP